MQPKTPNVYVQEKSIFPPSVAEVATAIPAFIGRTKVAVDGAGDSLVNQPIRITSLLEYERWFQGPYEEAFNLVAVYDGDNVVDVEFDRERKAPKMAPYILYQSVAHYFANGGGACYVVSVGTYEDTLPVASEEKAKFISALAAIEKVDEVTLLVMSDAAARMTEARTAVAGKAAVPGKDAVLDDDGNIVTPAVPAVPAVPAITAKTDDRGLYYEICTAAMDQCVKLQDRFTLIDTVDSITDDLSDDLSKLRANTPSAVGRTKYGAAYYPYLRTTTARSFDESKVKILLKDGTFATMSDDSLKGTALYTSLKVKLGSQYMLLPPAPAMAGIYSRVDGSRGVWKAPANVNVSGIVGPARIIDNDTQADMNVDTVAGKSINAIRSFTGKGTMVWGARTLAGNDNEWRYIPVRRLFNMVEESVQKATGFAVFEPNTPFTWLKLKTMIESYLESLWKQGALFGETKDMAFFVNVGLGQTMTEADINNGIMNIEIGLAAVRPAEFIILTFSHKSLEG